MQPSTTDDPTARIIRAIYTSAAVVAAAVLFAAFFVMRPALNEIEDGVFDVWVRVGDISGRVGDVRRNTEDRWLLAFDRDGRLRVVVEGR
ncbi:MAG: hypothetical protein H0W30_18720 [Gemmatimonadaceae bacterium]|nr:hypothetical protein [Gemmatimonadaceae bacterium]